MLGERPWSSPALGRWASTRCGKWFGLDHTRRCDPLASVSLMNELCRTLACAGPFAVFQHGGGGIAATHDHFQ